MFGFTKGIFLKLRTLEQFCISSLLAAVSACTWLQIQVFLLQYSRTRKYSSLFSTVHILQCSASALVSARIRIQHFRSMWIRLQIQGFEDKKLKNFTVQYKNFQSVCPYPFIMDVQTTGEASNPKKITFKDRRHLFVTPCWQVI